MLEAVEGFHETPLVPFREALHEMLLDRNCCDVLMSVRHLAQRCPDGLGPMPLRYRAADRLCGLLRRVPLMLPALRLGMQAAWKTLRLVKRALNGLRRPALPAPFIAPVPVSHLPRHAATVKPRLLAGPGARPATTLSRAA
jgi:hypothetical protein